MAPRQAAPCSLLRRRRPERPRFPWLKWCMSYLLAGVLLVGISLSVGTQNATAKPGYSVHPASKYRAFLVHGTHGSDVYVSVSAEGLVEVSAFQLRNSGFVEYTARGSYADDQVKARLPGVGRIKMRWKPSGKPEVTDEPQGDCVGRRALIQEGIFVGSFSFRGERSYTESKGEAGRGALDPNVSRSLRRTRRRASALYFLGRDPNCRQPRKRHERDRL